MIMIHTMFGDLVLIQLHLLNRGCGGRYLLPWIYSIMVNHSHYIMSQEPKNHQLLDTLLKVRDKTRAKDFVTSVKLA